MIWKIGVLILLMSIQSAQATPETRAYEKIFKINYNSCLKEMTSISKDKRKVFCGCADKVARANITHRQLDEYLNKKIKYGELFGPLTSKYGQCFRKIAGKDKKH